MIQSRRTFLKSSSSVAASGIIPSFLHTAGLSEKLNVPTTPSYRLSIHATNWGFNGSSEAFCALAKKDGFDGIEVLWPADEKEQEAILVAAKKHALAVAFLCRGDEAEPAKQLETFKKVVSAAATNRIQKPVYINCHSGRDYFDFDTNKKFFDYTLQLSRETGVNIYHETHRSRSLFAAHITRQYLEKIPELQLTLDISHWCNVHESLLEDQKETVALALSHTSHMHARMGHPEGPQVNDPRAPEWKDVVKQHFDWWDTVIARKKMKGEQATFLAEFGPPTYMPALPYTRQPVVDQWEVNVYIMKLLRARYQ